MLSQRCKWPQFSVFLWIVFCQIRRPALSLSLSSTRCQFKLTWLMWNALVLTVNDKYGLFLYKSANPLSPINSSPTTYPTPKRLSTLKKTLHRQLVRNSTFKGWVVSVTRLPNPFALSNQSEAQSHQPLFLWVSLHLPVSSYPLPPPLPPPFLSLYYNTTIMVN